MSDRADARPTEIRQRMIGRGYGADARLDIEELIALLETRTRDVVAYRAAGDRLQVVAELLELAAVDDGVGRFDHALTADQVRRARAIVDEIMAAWVRLSTESPT